MAVRSLQIRAKFITFIEIKAPKVQRCEKLNAISLSFATEHTHIVQGCKGFFDRRRDGAQVWHPQDFRAVAFGGG